MTSETASPEKTQAQLIKELPEGTLHAHVGVRWLPLVHKFRGPFVTAFDADGFWIVPVESGGVEVFATDGHSLISVFDPKGVANKSVFCRPTPELMRALAPNTDVVPFDENHMEEDDTNARPDRLFLSRSNRITRPDLNTDHVWVSGDDEDEEFGFFSQYVSTPACEHCKDKAYRDSIVFFEERQVPRDFRAIFAEPLAPISRACFDLRLFQRLGALMELTKERLAPAEVSFTRAFRLVVAHDAEDGCRIQMAIMPMTLDTIHDRRVRLKREAEELAKFKAAEKARAAESASSPEASPEATPTNEAKEGTV